MRSPKKTLFHVTGRRLIFWVPLCLLLALVEARAAPWDPPTDPARTPLPFSAGAAIARAPGPKPLPEDTPRAKRLDALGQAVAQVVTGQPGPGADRLARLTGLSGELADIAVYYQGLGRYLAGQPDTARTLLAPLADRAGTAFLGRDARYLTIQCAARLGDQADVLARATAWLAAPGSQLTPHVLLRAAVAADALGDTAKSQDFLRHLSLFAPGTDAAAAGDELARAVRGRPGATDAALYDPDSADNVLLRAEGLVEKRQAPAALKLLTTFSGTGPGQNARAAYIRGKALYAERRTKAAIAAFAQVAAMDPTAVLAPWALYHEARCLWRSRDPADARRMEDLLRQVLAAPGRDDRLREAAARHLALLLVEQGRLPEALTAAEQLSGLAVSPDLAAQGAALTALLHYATGDIARAETTLAAFATRFPRGAWASGARYWRAKALTALGRPEAAVPLLTGLVARRPNTYYGARAAAALEKLGAKPPAGSPRLAPRCPDTPEPPDQAVAALLTAAADLDQARLPRLADRLLGFACRRRPERIDLALAHIRSAESLGRRASVLRTAWRTFGGCLLQGSATAFGPLRQALYPRSHAAAVVAALTGTTVSPDILYALIRQESFFDPRAVSGAGAVGLMQLLPTTAQTVAKSLGQTVTRDALFDPDTNIRLGTTFFLNRLERLGNLPAALAGYNAGESRAARWNQALSPLGEELFIELIPYTETRQYVRRILANAAMYHRLYETKTEAKRPPAAGRD